jgi:hypothetical protein
MSAMMEKKKSEHGEKVAIFGGMGWLHVRRKPRIRAIPLWLRVPILWDKPVCLHGTV